MDALINGHGGDSDSDSHSSLDDLKPSVLVVILILLMTLLISLFICFLLRCLNRCSHQQSLSSSSVAASATVNSRRLSGHRVSPDITTSSLLDSLPIFKFSAVTRRSTSTISGDCAVCLSKFEPHDQLRLLPLCCHAFHVDCIDTWLVSNQTCPLCRSPLFAAESDLMKALLISSSSVDARGRGGGGDSSFRLEIGSISRRQSLPEIADQQRSYSIGSFDYIVDDESEVSVIDVNRRSISCKDEETVTVAVAALPLESSLAADVGSGSRNWLKDYVDRFSRSISSRALSFRSSGRFFPGSSCRTDELTASEIEATRAGEEISELFRWVSGV